MFFRNLSDENNLKEEKILCKNGFIGSLFLISMTDKIEEQEY